MDKETAKAAILKLWTGERWIWSDGDIAKAEVWRIYNNFMLHEVTLLGDEPFFDKLYHLNDVDKLVDTVLSWT